MAWLQTSRDWRRQAVRSFRVDVEAVPKARGCDSRGAVSDGEDYELLIAVSPANDLESLLRRWRKVFPKLKLTDDWRTYRSRNAGCRATARDLTIFCLAGNDRV